MMDFKLTFATFTALSRRLSSLSASRVCCCSRPIHLWTGKQQQASTVRNRYLCTMANDGGQLRYDGRVAIVTGAGGGLGRAYALLLGSRGASVVVNDLGGSRSGEGASSRMADLVVDEIKAKGGRAVANYDSVENGNAVVQTALDKFGRVDIVINNAGILRDKSVARTSDSDWDLVHQVHLRGAFQVTRAAWPHMKKQKYGRVIMTSSVAGLYGNFGQANYSAAKMGLVGLNNTLSIEGAKSNILCNVIVPMAASRLTEDILPPDLFESLKPELIAPIVAWMCHESFTDTGSIIEALGGWAGKYRWQRSQGSLLVDSLHEIPSVERVRDSWDKVTDMAGGDYPPTQGEATMGLMEKMSSLTAKSPAAGPSEGGPLSAVGWVSPPAPFAYTHKDVILYALGVGVSTRDEHGLQYLFEGHEAFSALPTFGVVPGFGGFFDLFNGSIPGLSVELSKVLHGEQYLEILSPSLPTDGQVHSTYTISAILDKRKGKIILVDVLTSDAKTQEPLVKNQMSIFVVGDGGFGGPRTTDKLVKTLPAPNRAPDASRSLKTNVDQAALYRLSGDSNPLHIDPNFAALGGFNEPILHGLCTYGIACKHIVEEYCQGDASKFKSMKARFAKPVLPGQTIVTDMWQEGNRIHFSCNVKETGQVCLSGGWAQLNETRSGQSDAPAASPLRSASVFEEMARHVEAQPQIARKVGALYQWVITKGGKPAGQWILDLKTPPGRVSAGPLPVGMKADCTLTLEDDDLVKMMSGELKPQAAFMKGKLKVTGNIMLTQKLETLIRSSSKL